MTSILFLAGPAADLEGAAEHLRPLAHPHDPVPVFGYSCGVEAPAVVLDREPHPVGGGDERTVARSAPACRATFVSASWQMR